MLFRTGNQEGFAPADVTNTQFKIPENTDVFINTPEIENNFMLPMNE